MPLVSTTAYTCDPCSVFTGEKGALSVGKHFMYVDFSIALLEVMHTSSQLRGQMCSFMLLEGCLLNVCKALFVGAESVKTVTVQRICC